MSADSQATSDSSDPGSPFSHSSSTHIEEMTSQSKLPKAQKRQSNLIEKNDNKKRVRKDFCTNNKNSSLEIKLVPIAPPASTQDSAVQQRKQSTNTSSNLIGDKAYNFLANKPHLITFNSVQTPSLTPNLNKMTDYYKLKKDLSDKVNGLQNTKQQQQQTNPPVNNSSQLKVVSTVGSTSVTPIQSDSPRPIDALKKTMTYEKKTAKIAPIIPVARKSAVCNIKPTKKPVSIAPRLEPKCSVVKKIENDVNNKIEQQKQLQQTPNKQQQIQQHVNNNQQSSGPTVLLAAIRIPPQQTHTNPSQPPPLGLIQKTTTTTTTTKLGPFVQLHHAAPHMIHPNIIQIPNLVSNSKAAAQNLAKSGVSQQQNSQTSQQQQQQNIYGNNSNEPHMLIKLQSHASASANASPQKPQHHHQNSFAAHLASHQVQQLFMASPVLFNASSLPAVLAQQLQHHPFGQIATSIASSSAIPALQPIQTPLISSYASSSMTTQTSQSLNLSSLNAILQSQNSAQQFQSLQLPQQQCFQTLLKSSSISMSPPSLALSQAFVQQRLNATTNHLQQQQQQQQQQQMMAKLSPSKSVPPLAPASNYPIQITKNIPKMISVKSSSSQTSPKTKSPPPLLINQKVSLPKSSPVAAAQLTNLKQEICVVPPLPSPAKVVTFDVVQKEEKIIFDEPQKDIKSSISVLVEEKISAEICAKSPILSQPKTIRFPPVNGKVTVWKKCVKISQKGVCNWEKCSKQFDSNSDLLDHLQDHIISQGGPYICSWRDCKVNGREGSRGWLERHIISHVGSTKPFKCIVERCGMRFGSQVRFL
jgi:hypothetical protein